MGFTNYKLLDKIPEYEYLKITSNSPKKIQSVFQMIKFFDEDTNQYVLYVPSIEMTACGDTPKEAEENIKYATDDYFTFLSSLSLKELRKELNKLGWIQNALKNKEYSKLYVDKRGDLKEFNISHVENLTLETTV